MEELESNSHTEILEERLKLAESELERALKAAEEAEKALAEIKIAPRTPPPMPGLPPPPPPMPALPLQPPPPPPLPTQNLAPPTAPLRTKKLRQSSVQEPEEANVSDGDSSGGNNNNGSAKKQPIGGVNDDIINQIKSGMFTLRKRKNNEAKKERETPKAVNEMLNILGSLRRTSKSKISVSAKFSDVQL